MDNQNPNPLPGSTTVQQTNPNIPPLVNTPDVQAQTQTQAAATTDTQATGQTGTSNALTLEDRVANLERCAFQQGGFQYLDSSE